MSKSRSRLAADWFAKLRTNPTTQVVEHTDVVDVEADVAAISVTPADVSDQANTSTGYLDLPSGTTAQRPSSADSGNTRYNSDNGSIEFYNGTQWVVTNLIPEITGISGSIKYNMATNLTLAVNKTTANITVKFVANSASVAEVQNVTPSGGNAVVAVPSAVYNLSPNTTVTISVLNSDGTPSSNSQSTTVVPTPTGGSITTYGNYRVHTFTSSGTFTLPSNVSNVDYLIVGGGGSGGGRHGGGGGAGGVLFIQGASIPSGSYNISIGAGAGGASSCENGYNGANTTAFGATAYGGGAGTSYNQNCSRIDGGSGGGGDSRGCNRGGTATQVNPPTPYGGTGNKYANNGGNGSAHLNGGGGGAGGAGGSYDGGAGKQITGMSPTGANLYWGGGGGGGMWSDHTRAGNGGIGGGGGGSAALGGNIGGNGGGSALNAGQSSAQAGDSGKNTNAGDGGANTGGGGGGVAQACHEGYSGTSGNGGSGVVIVRYSM